MAGRFGSLITAMVTPFREEGHALDVDGAQRLASHLLDSGSERRGPVPPVSRRRSPTRRRAELFRAVGESRTPREADLRYWYVLTAETLELTQAAETRAPTGRRDADYNKPPQRGLIAHFERVADATELPIIVYNIPGRTATRIEHETLLQLAERPNIVAVKDSTGDFQGVSRLMAEAPPDFEVYSGDDWATFGYVCLGAVGLVSVASHLVGPQIRQMIELIQTGDVPAARKIHEDLSPLFNALFITSNPIPLKAALEMIGLPAGVPRLPLVPATAEERTRVRKALEDAGLL
jgi:4-hydroxy-tetrahydrodipicolinate synthase